MGLPSRPYYAVVIQFIFQYVFAEHASRALARSALVVSTTTVTLVPTTLQSHIQNYRITDLAATPATNANAVNEEHLRRATTYVAEAAKITHVNIMGLQTMKEMRRHKLNNKDEQQKQCHRNMHASNGVSMASQPV